MLKTVNLTGKYQSGAPCVMLLGGFDGAHVGHRKLISHAREYGLPVGAMTIGGGKKKKNLFTFSEREDIFRSLSVDFVFELPFSEIRDLPPADFVRILTEAFSPRAFVCGEDFRFGKGAEGTPKQIKDLTRVSVEILKLVCVDGEKASSSLVKELLEKGDAARAAKVLGEPFFLKGEVVKDRQVGRLMGFPTANILYPEEKFALKKGVYEAAAEVDGKEYKGISNFGSRPTFGNARVLTETYLDGFDGDLYGRTITVRFLRYLRDIKKFEDMNALKGQLESDIERVRSNR